MATSLGKFSVAFSKEMNPVKGQEVTDTKGFYKVGLQYQKKIMDFTLSFNFANEHIEKYSEKGSPIADIEPSIPLPEAAVYLRVADADPSDGWGGRFYGVVVAFYGPSGEISRISYNAGDPEEANYVVVNTGSWDAGISAWFFDNYNEYIARFPIPSAEVTKIYIVAKVDSGAPKYDRLVQISVDGANFYTIEDSLLAPSDASTYSSIIVYKDSPVAVDATVNVGDPSTWEDNAVSTSITEVTIDKAFSSGTLIWKNIYGASLKGTVGWKDPYNVDVVASVARAVTRKAYPIGYATEKATAWYVKLSKDFLFHGVWQPSLEVYRIDAGYDASDFVDTRVNFERREEYGPEDDVLPEILLPKVLDFNLNGVVDAVEDFYMADSEFPIFYIDSDYNLNTFPDSLEVSATTPDYYGKSSARFGKHISVYYSPFPQLDLMTGYINEQSLIGNTTSSSFYAQAKLGLSASLFSATLFNRVYYVRRNYWDNFVGWCDGYDNDLDGQIDEQDELSSPTTKIYYWLRKSLLDRAVARAGVYTPWGFTGELKLGLLAVNDFLNSRSWIKSGVGTIVKYEKDFSPIVGVKTYFKGDVLTQSVDGDVFTLTLPTAGFVLRYSIASGLLINIGTERSYYLYSYNSDASHSRQVFIMEAYGRNVYLGKDFLVKFAFRLWKDNYFDLDTSSWQNRFYVRAYFFW